jgi:hypothetical protein
MARTCLEQYFKPAPEKQITLPVGMPSAVPGKHQEAPLNLPRDSLLVSWNLSWIASILSFSKDVPRSFKVHVSKNYAEF